METITFTKKQFPLRILNFKDFGEVRISTEELNDLLMNGSDYISEKARTIDEEIFFYIPSDVIKKSDKFIKTFILENI